MMTADYYEANDREYDETKELLMSNERMTTRDLLSIIYLGKEQCNREGTSVYFSDTEFEVRLVDGSIYRVKTSNAEYVGNIADAD